MPGLKIEIDEAGFLKKNAQEQRLELYKAISYINGHGCRWAKGKWKKIFLGGIAAGGGGGVIANIPGIKQLLTKIL